MNNDQIRERLIQLTRDLVLIESTDNRLEERRRCFQLVRNHLEEIDNLAITMVEKNGYESMLAMPKGIDRPAILLCGHLDVVHHPEPDSYKTTVRDGRIYGPGTGDMKGQLAIMIELMRTIGREQPGLSLGMAVTSDEERGGENGVKFLLEEHGLRCGQAIVPDGGSLNRIIVEEKGIIHAWVIASGSSAHAARPWLGDNALEKLSRDLQAIKAHFAKEWPPQVDIKDTNTHWFSTFTITQIDTPNDSPNRIPEVARAVVDIRFVPPRSVDSVLAEVRQFLSQGVSIEPMVAADPSHLAPDQAFVKITEEETGAPAKLERASGGSDSRFFCTHGMPVILSGPNVGNLHGREEWVDIDSMVAYFKICLRYILMKGEA